MLLWGRGIIVPNFTFVQLFRIYIVEQDGRCLSLMKEVCIFLLAIRDVSRVDLVGHNTTSIRNASDL